MSQEEEEHKSASLSKDQREGDGRQPVMSPVTPTGDFFKESESNFNTKDRDKKHKRRWNSFKQYTKKRRSSKKFYKEAASEPQATNVLSRPSTPPASLLVEGKTVGGEASNVITREHAHSGALLLQDVFLMKVRDHYKNDDNTTHFTNSTESSLENLLDNVSLDSTASPVLEDDPLFDNKDPAKVDHSPEEPLDDASPVEIPQNEDVAVVPSPSELNHVVAVLTDEVEERVGELVVYVTPPEAIVNEVEALQVETPLESNGAISLVMTFEKDWSVLTTNRGISLRLISTDEAGTCLTDDQGQFVTSTFPSSTTFIRTSNDSTDENNTSVSCFGIDDRIKIISEQVSSESSQNAKFAEFNPILSVAAAVTSENTHKGSEPSTYTSPATSLLNKDATPAFQSPLNTENSLGIPGVEVLANTSLTLTNSPTTFEWIGLRLTVPPDSLPAGEDQCQLDIMASVAGEYEFPDNLQLLSGVFWVHSSLCGQFRRPLTVEIQHCAKMTSSTKLSFVIAHRSQQILPYRFKEIEGHGSFTEDSSYGSLEVTHFCGLAVAGENADKLYAVHLYYLHLEENTDSVTCDTHVAVLLNTTTHIEARDRYYMREGAKKGPYLTIQFDKEHLSLDIPMLEGVKHSGWTIYALVTPIVTQKEVDSFEPGRTIPSFQLKAELVNKEPFQKLKYLLNLEGAKEPKKQLVLEVDRPKSLLNRTLSSPAKMSISSPPMTPSPTSLSAAQPTKDVTLTVNHIKEVFKILHKAREMWQLIGEGIGCASDDLREIKHNHSSITLRLREMFERRIQRGGLTCSMLCNALREEVVGRDDVAEEIENLVKKF